MKNSYRGFDIVLAAADEWSAEIINQSTGKAFTHRAKAPIAGGQAECLKRAQNLVDAFLALHGTQTA
jgi:hypothetical protein